MSVQKQRNARLLAYQSRARWSRAESGSRRARRGRGVAGGAGTDASRVGYSAPIGGVVKLPRGCVNFDTFRRFFAPSSPEGADPDAPPVRRGVGAEKGPGDPQLRKKAFSYSRRKAQPTPPVRSKRRGTHASENFRQTSRVFYPPDYDEDEWTDKELLQYLIELHCAVRSWFDLDSYNLYIAKDNDPSNPSAFLNVETDLSYKQVRITHFPNVEQFWENGWKRDIMRGVVHEWIHVLIEPVVAVARTAVAPVMAPYFEMELERVMEGLTRVITVGLPENITKRFT